MDDDASYGNGAQQQQNGGMSGSSDLGIVPEVWLDEESGNVVATLKGTNIVIVTCAAWDVEYGCQCACCVTTNT
eukprot:944350-Pelagomonas_calceolata.AAC.4